MAELGFEAVAICPVFDAEHDLAAAGSYRRQRGVDLLPGIDLAEAAGAPVVIAVPSVTRTCALGGRSDSLSQAADAPAQVAQQVAADGPTLVNEPLHCCEIHLIRTVGQAADLARTDLPNVGIMGDLFHMNIEETTTTPCPQPHADLVRDLHLVDKHRGAPGAGRLDVAAILHDAALINYGGALVLECEPDDDEDLAAARTLLTMLMSALTVSA